MARTDCRGKTRLCDYSVVDYTVGQHEHGNNKPLARETVSYEGGRYQGVHCIRLLWSHTKKQQSSSASSMKESVIVVLKRKRKNVTEKDQLKRQIAQVGISHQSWQHETSDRDSWRSSVRKASRKGSRQRGVKPQREDAGSRRSEQHLNHPQPKPSPVHGAVGSARQESDSRGTNGH